MKPTSKLYTANQESVPIIFCRQNSHHGSRYV